MKKFECPSSNKVLWNCQNAFIILSIVSANVSFQSKATNAQPMTMLFFAFHWSINGLGIPINQCQPLLGENINYNYRGLDYELKLEIPHPSSADRCVVVQIEKVANKRVSHRDKKFNYFTPHLRSHSADKESTITEGCLSQPHYLAIEDNLELFCNKSNSSCAVVDRTRLKHTRLRLP